jgi:hypothetical protein
VESQYAVLWHALEFAALHFIIVQVARPSLLKQETPLREIVDFDISNSISRSRTSVVGIVSKVRDHSVRGMEETFHIE